MANFCANQVVIAADKERMLSAFKVMAFNLASWTENKDDRDYLEDCTTVDAAYDRIRPKIDANYDCIFAPSPESANAWLEENRSRIDELIANEPAYANIAKTLGLKKDGPSPRFEYTYPNSARPLSGSASVALKRFGSTLVLVISYCTAWVGNYEEANFLEYMVTGDKWADYSEEDYGFCHFYQDESWETINIADDEAWYPKELVEDAWDNASVQLNKETNRSKIAWQVALCSWPNGAGYDNWPRGKKYKMPSLDARKNQRDSAPADEKPRKESTSHWYRRMCIPRTDSDYEELDSLLIEALNDFPRDITGRFEASFDPEYPKSIRPFDRLGIEAYWDDSELEYECDDPDFDEDDDDIDDFISWPIPEINVKTRGDIEQGEHGPWTRRQTVCYLSDNLKNAKQKVAYVYLAPFMLATATKACLSKSYKNEVNLTLHLELVPFELNELLASVHETAKKPYDDRGRLFVPERRA